MKARAEIETPSRARGVLVDVLILLALVSFSAWVRLDTVAADGILTRVPEEGLLKSDPGLLYYLTERVASAEGATPSDWRADPRIAHPDSIDIPADYTVGQEFLLGWSWRAFGGEISLLRWCHYGSSLMAALAVLGVWGLARELCGGRLWPFLASVLYLCLPASYRTIGFLLIREDLSLPLFALHLWLAARAARLGTRSSILWAALAAAGALATWHAMSLVFAIEAAVLVMLLFARGRNAMGQHGLWVLGILVLAWLLVPALGGGAFLGGLLLLGCLFLAPRLRPAQPRLTCLALVIASGAVALALGPGAESNFSHVYEVLQAKLVNGGVLPDDPNQLSFDARMLWQGPFQTLGWQHALGILGAALVLGAPACVMGLCSRRDLAFCLGLFGLISLSVSWLVLRFSALPAILLPPLVIFAVCQLHTRLRSAGSWESSADEERTLTELGYRILPMLGALLLSWQCLSFQDWRAGFVFSWYRPERRATEIAEMVEAVRRLVPEGQAVACDFMNSTAILAHTARPMVLQPKWERAPARRRVQTFWDAFYTGTPGDLKALLKGAYQCRYLVIDRYTLWTLDVSRYAAGFSRGEIQQRPGTAAEALLDGALSPGGAGVEGYQLLWSSPAGSEPGRPPAFRLFELE